MCVCVESRRNRAGKKNLKGSGIGSEIHLTRKQISKGRKGTNNRDAGGCIVKWGVNKSKVY